MAEQKDTSDLPPDEIYVVKMLRDAGKGSSLRLDPNSRPYLCVGGVVVCTFDTLFRMLGRDVIRLDPTAPRADRWELTEEWV